MGVCTETKHRVDCQFGFINRRGHVAIANNSQWSGTEHDAKEDKSKTQLTNYRTIIHYGVETITTKVLIEYFVI